MERPPEPAVRLRLSTLRATMPTRRAPRTPIQPRPRVRRMITLESEKSRTAPALRTAACGNSAAPATAGLISRAAGAWRAEAWRAPGRTADARVRLRGLRREAGRDSGRG